MCTVPWTLLVVCAGPDLVVVCASLKREEEPHCCVRRLKLIVSPSLKIIKDDSSVDVASPLEVNHVYMVSFVFGYLFMLLLNE